VPGSLLALDVLVFIPVRNEHRGGYERDRFGYPNDADGDGCNTRDEVLARDSSTLPQIDAFGCQVIAGDWYSPYDGRTLSDPADIQIDHLVALKEAWDSGAWAWDDARLRAFGNDLDDTRALRAVSSESNQSKSENDPSNWLPPNDGYVCTYLADWIAVKARWSLSMDQSEYGRIRNVLRDRCPDQVIAPWTPAPPPAEVPIVPALSPPPPTVAETPPPSTTCDPSYPTVCIPPSPPDLDCGDIPHRRFTVLPPDPHRFDGNDDGVGCEG
jgi:hypothetical protein